MGNEIVLGLGCQPSIIDGSEFIYEGKNTLQLPEEYSFQSQMPPVLNQGTTNMCVTYACGAHIDWNINMDYGTECKDNHVDRKGIYSVRSVKGDNGMTFKEAFKYLRENGVKTDDGIRKIDYYAKIGNDRDLKCALIANGPCLAGLMCYNNTTQFWKSMNGEKAQGGHAVSLVGWNKEGFIIRNSWGTGYGFGGYSVLRYEDFNNLFEVWTIID